MLLKYKTTVDFNFYADEDTLVNVSADILAGAGITDDATLPDDVLDAGSDTDADTHTDDVDAGEQQPSTQDVQDFDLPDDMKAQPQQQQPVESPVEEPTPTQRGEYELVMSRDGHVRDKNTNKIVFRKGAQARMFTKIADDARNARSETEQIRMQHTQLNDNYNRLQSAAKDMFHEFKGMKEAATALSDLSPEDRELAATLIPALRANPVEGVKKLLTTLASRGINFSDLGIQNGGLDVGTLVQQLDDRISQKLSPVTDRLQEDQRAQEAYARAQEFDRNNPLARPYHERIMQYMNATNIRDPQIAWDNIVLAALKKGINLLDQPSPESSTQDVQPEQQASSQPSTPIPTGKGSVPRVPARQGQFDLTPADPRQSWDEVFNNVERDLAQLGVLD